NRAVLHVPRRDGAFGVATQDTSHTTSEFGRRHHRAATSSKPAHRARPGNPSGPTKNCSGCPKSSALPPYDPGLWFLDRRRGAARELPMAVLASRVLIPVDVANLTSEALELARSHTGTTAGAHVVAVFAA